MEPTREYFYAEIETIIGKIPNIFYVCNSNVKVYKQGYKKRGR